MVGGVLHCGFIGMNYWREVFVLKMTIVKAASEVFVIILSKWGLLEQLPLPFRLQSSERMSRLVVQ